MLINLVAFPLQTVSKGMEGIECFVLLSDTDEICLNEKV